MLNFLSCVNTVKEFIALLLRNVVGMHRCSIDLRLRIYYKHKCIFMIWVFLVKSCLLNKRIKVHIFMNSFVGLLIPIVYFK